MSNMKRLADSAAWPQHITKPKRWSDFRADGRTYDPAQDQQRLGKQAQVVWETMTVWDAEFPQDMSGKWWTLWQLADATGFPESSISARLRDFRKPRFGGHTVERRRWKDGVGTWEYRLVVNRGGNDE